MFNYKQEKEKETREFEHFLNVKCKDLSIFETISFLYEFLEKDDISLEIELNTTNSSYIVFNRFGFQFFGVFRRSKYNIPIFDYFSFSEIE